MTVSIPPDGEIIIPMNEIAKSEIAKSEIAKSEIEGVAPAAVTGPTGKDRRRRRRVRMDVGVFLRGGMGTVEAFEDRGRTIDVSRDGILLVTSRAGYWQGQIVDVAFPYTESPGAIFVPQQARIVRTHILPDHRVTLGLELNPGPPSHFALSNSQSQVTVLAVESDPGTAQSLREMLNEEGYLAVVVDSPAQALGVLRSENGSRGRRTFRP
jgi:hypothetical protein